MSVREAGKYPVGEDVLARFAALGRETGTLTAVRQTRLAERLGLSGTEYRTLELVAQSSGPLTAGRIAELTGLSTGAVTGVVDRLERAGFARRVRDADDRRRVLVEVVPAEPARDEPAVEALGDVLSSFSPGELEVVERFGQSMLAALRSEVLGDSAHV
jgi:DNA-binding MarR family transcriptional regulator